jgi:inosine-uridine nucleoside N-ribohydrolase
MMRPWLGGALVLAACAPSPREALQAAPVRIIFDADMDSDCDDVGALAVLHALADLGEAEILATMASSKNEQTPLCLDAVNTWYGRPDLPIGVPKGAGAARASKYAGEVARRFPHALRSAADAPDAARLYRELLRREADQSVVIVTVGFMTNLADLLRLPAEGALPSGVDVVRRKVRLWACMGGNFVGRPAKDDLKLGNVNFTVDKAAAHHAIRHWPGPIMFVGREIGSVPSGLKVGARLRGLPAANPVRVAYEAYFGGEAKDRHVADPTAVLFAVRGRRDLWDAETRGYMDLQPDMTFEWKYDRDAGQGYLLKRAGNDRLVEREIEALMMRPPRSR